MRYAKKLQTLFDIGSWWIYFQRKYAKQYITLFSLVEKYLVILIICTYNLIEMHRTNMAEWDYESRSL